MPTGHSAFGEDNFGRRAEAAARFLGTPRYIAAQSLVVVVWIALNAVAVGMRWDPYPFILLAQTRQADRDKAAVEHLEAHREEVMKHMEDREAALKQQTSELKELLATNTALTQQDKELTERIEMLTREIHTRLTAS